jgi:hypothetical protein
VLKQIALSTDPAAEEAARQALTEVAALRIGTASQNASETLATLSVIREQRALEELLALGAKSQPDPFDPFGEKYNLTIDAEWKGRDDDLRRLPLLVNMSRLAFSGEKVTDQWLVYAGEAEQLTDLTIDRAKISDDSLAHLIPLPQLRTIQLKYVPVSDGSLMHLAAMKNTLEFELYGTQITIEGAERLKQQLANAKVDHRLGAFLGISAALHPLGCMITDVRSQTAASRSGLMLGDIIVKYSGERVYDFDTLTALISRNRPKDEVELQFVRNVEIRTGLRVKREDDQLGLQGQDHPAGCEVSAVERNSIAAYLGIRKGDIIYQANDQIVSKLQDLEQAVNAVKAGDPVTLDYARGLELRTIRVQLGEWE